jgi:hypothetical protein
MQQLAADSIKDDSSLAILCLANAAWCLTEMDEYDKAYTELDSLLNHADKDYDRMTLSLDMLLNQLKSDNYEGIGKQRAFSESRFAERFDAVDSQLNALLSHRNSPRAKSESKPLPMRFVLHPIYPNPFNATTTIGYELPANSVVKLNVLDILGRRVQEFNYGLQTAGVHEVRFDGSKLASGTYLVKVQAGSFEGVQKMILLK